MIKPCSVPQCHQQTAGYSTLCERHKRAQRRHGHPEQVGVTVNELAPYRRRVVSRMKKNSGSDAWNILRQRWDKIMESARQTEAVYRSGTAHVTYDRQALLELFKIGNNVEVNALIETTLAIYLMQLEQPHRFKTDTAFDMQLARRVRGLTDTNAGTYWDNKTKKTKRVYKDIPPRTLMALAEHIKTSFGVAGVYVAKLEQQEAEQQNNERAALAAALEGLK